MPWCIYDWKHVTLCILGPPFGLNHYLFARFGGIGGPKKIIWDSRKKLRGLRGKYAEFGRLVGLQWFHGRPWWSCRCCGRTSKSLKSQWWIWVGHVPWRLWLTVCFWHLERLSWFPGGQLKQPMVKKVPRFLMLITIRKTSCMNDEISD